MLVDGPDNHPNLQTTLVSDDYFKKILVQANVSVTAFPGQTYGNDC